MNAVNFLNNLNLALEQLKNFSLTEERRIELATQLAVKMQELEFASRELAMKEEEAMQSLELKAIEARHKYESGSAELVKSLVQAEAMIKSVWDNANINKSNALVGLLNVALNAQNVNNLSNWRNYFTEIKNTIYAIGNDEDGKNKRNALVDNFSPLLQNIRSGIAGLTELSRSIKQVMIVVPKYEVLENEVLVARGLAAVEGERYFLQGDAKYTQDTFLFKKSAPGDYHLSFCVKQKTGAVIEDKILIKVITKGG